MALTQSVDSTTVEMKMTLGPVAVVVAVVVVVVMN